MRVVLWVLAILALQTPGLARSSQGRALRFEKIGQVVYKTVMNGHEAPDEGKVVLLCGPATARLGLLEPGRPLPGAPEETKFVDFAAAKTYQVAEFPDGHRCTVVADFSSLPKLEPAGGQAVILGYTCRRAKTVIRSNQIEVWYTEKAGLRGTPALNLIIEEGLILKMVRNGNYEVVAEKIELAKKPSPAPALPADWGEIVDASAYRARVAESTITTVEVFHREQISFAEERVSSGRPPLHDSTGAFLPRAGESVLRYAGGTVLLRKIHLPEVSDDFSLFAELVQYSNGDAYDRTGSIFIIPVDRAASFLDGLEKGIWALPVIKDREGKAYQGIAATDGYLPPLELVRFITPFGVRFFNGQVTVQGLSWEDSVLYKQDLTDLLPALRGDVWIGAFIGNYDKGGHILSLKLRYYPNSRRLPEVPKDAAASAEPGEPAKHWIFPLFNTVNILEMAGQEYARLFGHDSLRVAVVVPPGLKSCTLRYLTTGHGGWENGDEFNRRTNEIFLDGGRVASVTPWRTDCASYRRYNPASGNFWNGISSSDLSRSGWCPGASVNPIMVPLPNLAPGRHVLKVAIPMGPPEGGSFSAWNVSGVLVGDF